MVLSGVTLYLEMDKANLLPIDVKDFGLKSFLIFPMLIFPMEVSEAGQCLPEFVEVIQSMHQQPLQRAHLDIRLQNICFRIYK